MASLADDRPAIGGHGFGNLLFHGMAEGVVGAQQVPAVTAFGDDRLGRTVGDRVGVVNVVNVIGRAVFVGQAGRRRCRDNGEAVFFFHQTGHGDGHR
ncbi:hypothetical protein D3C84_1105260 [compost metagenome]